MLTSSFLLNFKEKNNLFFKLLQEEDYDFRNKDIKISLENNTNQINATIHASSILELKIGVSAFIKSLEIIDKTLNI